MFNLGEISMKKSLVALAALAATTVFAQSSVTLYGIADVYLGNKKTTGTTATGADATYTAAQGSGVGQNVLNAGGLSGSRFGLRGSEDLGGGLKANFLMENGHNTDLGNNAQGGLMFGRQIYVGLSGGFGEVRFGRQYSAYDELRGATDTLGHTSFSSTVADGAWDKVGLAYTARNDNAIRYATNSFGGFSAAFSYALGENKTATASAGNILAAHALYANGPITAGLGFQQEKAAGSAPGGKQTFVLLAGAYDFGVAKLYAGLNTGKDNSTVQNKETEFHIGASAPLGPVTLAVDYATAKHKDVEKGTSLGLQATYALSKRTDTYFGLVSSKDTSLINNDKSGEKRQLVAVGVRHKF
jgi:predicted porin